MNCIYCQKPVPDKWYEFHCIPVARVEGNWVDMYDRLSELDLPINQVAHWVCHMEEKTSVRPVSRVASPTGK